MKIIEQKIIKWIRRKVKEANAKGIVIGLSGGIDSSVVVVLAQKALGKNNVESLIMPCKSLIQDSDDAHLLAKKFDIKTLTLDLNEIYNSFFHSLPIPLFPNNTATSNLKARLRMCLLYFMANQYNYLVCGTGNKTEIGIGYFTKYGDGGVDIEPIGDLYKGDVRELARYLGIPKRIIEKAPSAGLWVGQTDEKELGITYEELDKNLKAEYSKDVEEKVINMIEGSKHKRNIPPICKIN